MSSLLSFEYPAHGDMVIDSDTAARDHVHLGPYRGPDRRRTAHRQESWLQRLLDEIDYGVMVLSGSAELIHANHAARVALARGCVITAHDGRVRPRSNEDAQGLSDALIGATRRDKRCMIQLGKGSQELNVSIIPLAATPGSEPMAAALLGKQAVCEQLSIEWFARLNGMTLAETRVLSALSQGVRVRDVAELNAVELCTVRTQVGAIRAKTGAGSLGELLARLALLPPLRGALRSLGR